MTITQSSVEIAQAVEAFRVEVKTLNQTIAKLRIVARRVDTDTRGILTDNETASVVERIESLASAVDEVEMELYEVLEDVTERGREAREARRVECGYGPRPVSS